MQASFQDMRRQITSLIDDLDNEARGRDQVEKQKSSYKAKLRFANQRMKHVCYNFDQMALLIYQQVVTKSFETQFSTGEGNKIDNLAFEIQNLDAAIKLKEEQIKKEEALIY